MFEQLKFGNDGNFLHGGKILLICNINMDKYIKILFDNFCEAWSEDSVWQFWARFDKFLGL